MFEKLMTMTAVGAGELIGKAVDTVKKRVGVLFVDGTVSIWVGRRNPRHNIGFTVGPFFATLNIDNDPVSQITLFDAQYTNNIDWSWGLAEIEPDFSDDDLVYNERINSDEEVECVDCGCDIIKDFRLPDSEQRCYTDREALRWKRWELK